MAEASWLCSLPAVRERCGALLALAEANALPHFVVDPSRLGDAAAYVARTIQEAYPAGRIPAHSRWRHFTAGGIDRWGALQEALRPTPSEVTRLRIELCLVSVLLDAGAGAGWRFVEPGTGLELRRSEGLAVASLHAFKAGLFSSLARPEVDAAGLTALTAERLAAAFQVSEDNVLPGLEQRAALLQRLGASIRGRLGGLREALVRRGQTTAPHLVGVLIERLAPVWPERTVLDGVRLGDVWPHSCAPDDGMVPFHKLTQWLAFSLIEVFEEAGIVVEDIGALTGLPEYRNGGLLIDTGVLTPREPVHGPLPAGHELIVEWRALTVALLDRLRPLVSAALGRDLTMAQLLEGGTWSAGRALALERRPGGRPPIEIISDGTVF